tara:strand:+ start:6406 stop:7059 length:654 start_codon:yes stop_codon:yes gene_type:complete
MKCDYCGKVFKRESTLMSHICEKKRRWLQKDFPETRAGFVAFDLFYRLGMQSKPKEYKHFVDSQYFSAFVKFGSYCINTKVIDPEAYTRWLVRKQAKLRDWATDTMYMLFVKEHLKKETVDRALERFIEQASKTAYFDTFWESAGGYVIADWVESGKISPWLVICSSRAQAALNSMNEECFNRVANSIDPAHWGKKTKQQPQDCSWVRHIIDGEKHD